ncbi:hypothetical protein EZV61_00015 [Corallincola luteus]|uniref:Pyrrolo-quinoline quinone repeat domain-containing protein n=1 Tax=Corallincola luteus TaxID=1775177 RepID=A0ABY2AMG3_9GAMM|nr:PQQ-binding-like beta-propeller repeat protein [Corallincola luteus]TCI04399.1 hypothetical protein EZV61_00015 [Corallincola luteus]
MILCDGYTSYRVCEQRELVGFPLTLFKKIEVCVPSIFIYENNLYFPNEDGRLACYDQITFENIWVSDTDKLLPIYPLVSNDSILVVRYSDEKVSRIKLGNGEFIENLDFRYSSKWLINDEVIYARGYNRNKECKYSIKAICSNTFTIGWEYSRLDFGNFSVSKSYVLLKSDSGVFFALDKSGNELWSHSVSRNPSLFEIDGADLSQSSEGEGINSFNTTLGDPIIYDDRIGVLPVLCNQLAGIDLKTGDVLWLRKLSRSASSSRVAYGKILYCMGENHIEAICLNTGGVKKIIEVDTSLLHKKLNIKDIDFGLFTVTDTHIFAASQSCHVFVAINLSSGVIEWFFSPENPIGSTNVPYVSNGRVYFPCFKQLYVFEASNGFTSLR